jgi:hypothetical protein
MSDEFAAGPRIRCEYARADEVPATVVAVRETPIMSTVDANRVVLTGENSVIRLNPHDSDAFTTSATFWRLLTSPRGPGQVLYLKSELTEARWRIYADNIAMTRWLQSTVLGAINPELRDLTIPVIEARFTKSGDARDFWTERLEARREEVELTWYELGEPFLVHTQPNSVPGRPYGMCTILIPALGARLTHNGVEAEGRPWPRDREGRASSTCVLGLCESWTEAG